MTDYLFRDDAYLAEVEARVVASGPEGVELDRTIFYATSAVTPGDSGRLIAGGREIAVTGTIHPEGDRLRVLHLLEPDALPPGAGAGVGLALGWERRLRLMRMHSALHLLSVVLPHGVTGGQVGGGKGGLDFRMPRPPGARGAAGGQ